jgi:hypothetical protein
MLRDAKIAAEQRLGRGSAETHDHLGLERGDFGVEPGAASGDFRGVGLFVDAAFAARLPFEMFYGVGDVDFFAVDAGFDESGVEQLASRAYEWTALEIFLISRLFADEHDLCVGPAFAEDGLGATLPEIAILAILGSFGQLGEGGMWRNLQIGWRATFRHTSSLLSEWRPIYAEDEAEFQLAYGFFRSRSHFGPPPLSGSGNFRFGRGRQDSFTCAVQFLSRRASECFRCGFHSIQLVPQFAQLFFEFSLFAFDCRQKIHSIPPGGNLSQSGGDAPDVSAKERDGGKQRGKEVRV